MSRPSKKAGSTLDLIDELSLSYSNNTKSQNKNQIINDNKSNKSINDDYYKPQFPHIECRAPKDGVNINPETLYQEAMYDE